MKSSNSDWEKVQIHGVGHIHGKKGWVKHPGLGMTRIAL